MTVTFLDPTLAPNPEPVPEPPAARPSVAEQITGPVGLCVMAIAAVVVIVLLMHSVQSGRQALAVSHRQTVAAQGQTAAARADEAQAHAAAEAMASAYRSTTSALTAANTKLTADHVTAVRSMACINSLMDVMQGLISNYGWSAAFDRAAVPCTNIGPQLAATGTP